MLYPLRFQPIFRRYMWGGRRLQTVLAKPIGDGNDCAESWEVVDHGDDQSTIVNGPLAGKSLHEIVQQFGPDLLGEYWHARILDPDLPENLHGRFPLLLKFLDARLPLSVQVHPDDAAAAKLPTPDLGKTEAWYVIDCDAQSRIYAGLKPGTSREALRAAVASGHTESLLHSFSPQPGDCVFIPAGTVHAIGANLLITEIQQASDTTFRLFDWNRVDAAGKSRPLHVDQALQVIDFGRGPVDAIRVADQSDSTPIELVTCDKFLLSRIRLADATAIGGDGRLRILVAISGTLKVSSAAVAVDMKIGDCILLPASHPAVELVPNLVAELLIVELPE